VALIVLAENQSTVQLIGCFSMVQLRAVRFVHNYFYNLYEPGKAHRDEASIVETLGFKSF